MRKVLRIISSLDLLSVRFTSAERSAFLFWGLWLVFTQRLPATLCPAFVGQRVDRATH